MSGKDRERLYHYAKGIGDASRPRRLGPMRKHEFVRRENADGGHLDRKCEACGLEDTNPVHDNAKGEGL